MKQQHTNWKISFGKVVDSNGETVCVSPSRPSKESANLICAAPDLLDALKAVTEAMRDCPEFAEFFTLHDGRSIQPLGFARAAIAKAEGRAE